MTVSSAVRKAGPYTGNGAVAVYPFDFKVYTKSDIEVIQADLNDVETTLVVDSDYTVTMNADQNNDPGGFITLTAGALTTNYQLSIIGALIEDQLTDLTNLGNFFPQTVEDMVDRNTILIQQLREVLDRTFQAPVTSTASLDINDLIADILSVTAKVDTFNGVYYGALASNPSVDPLGNPPTSGDMYYNYVTHQLLIYDATLLTWNSQPAGASLTNNVFSGTGAQVNFTLSRDPASINNLIVFVGGVLQRPTIDYTYVTTTLTFVTAPPNAANNVVAYVLTGTVVGSVDGANITGFVPSTILRYARTSAEQTVGVTPVNYYYPPGHVYRYGTNTTPGTTPMSAAINSAIASWNGKGGTVIVPDQLLLDSAITCAAYGIKFVGYGYSETNGTGSANRGASCFIRGFASASPTILISGNDCGFDLIDVDNDNQGTGDGLQVTGSRFKGGSFSCRNSGGDGFRVGKTNAGASDTNTNAWHADYVIVCGNASSGMRVDDTNTTTSLSYPLGLANVNAGYCGHLDARNNGSDGLTLGNCNDNVFGMVASQSNTGCGIRFKTDGTNSGPRCNKILGNDCEANTGNDIQIDAATLPASAPGLYNVVLGNRSVAVNSRIVDNSTGSLVMQWVANLGFRAYHSGSDVNALSTSGNAGFNAYVGANSSPVRFYGVASGTVDGKARISVHKNGGAQTDAIEINQNAVFTPLTDYVALTYSASINLDASLGHIFSITATNGTAFTINTPTNPYLGQRIKIVIRNNSGGAMGAITWPANFKMAWGNPANGNQRVLNVFYDGTNWIMSTATTNDIPL